MYIKTSCMRKAIRDFEDWYFGKDFKTRPIFRQGGYAGTGKTTLLKYITETYGFNQANSITMAYTGQACNVLRSKNIMANTIHSTLMHVIEAYVYKNGEIVKVNGIPITTEKYIPISELPSGIKIIFIDEGSFVPEELLKLAAKFEIPIYMTGDPMQLPPVQGKDCFHMDMMDNIMQTTMRQHSDSEILDLATRIRTGDKIHMSSYNKDVLFAKGYPGNIEKTFDKYTDFFKYSQMILCTTNKQRQGINDMYRKNIIGTTNPFPVKGERVICRKNNRKMMIGDYYLANGTIGTVMNTVSRSMVDSTKSIYFMDFKPDFSYDGEYYDNLICDSKYLLTPISSDKKPDKYNIGNKMEYAYGTTVHLAQGAQAPVVTFADGYTGGDLEYNMRLRYTAVTRAQKKLIYLL